jgi:hypothetical protein
VFLRRLLRICKKSIWHTVCCHAFVLRNESSKERQQQFLLTLLQLFFKDHQFSRLYYIIFRRGCDIFFFLFVWLFFLYIFVSVCLSVPICLSIVLFLMYHRLLYNYFLRRYSSECPLISFDNGDHSNITYLASAFILD